MRVAHDGGRRDDGLPPGQSGAPCEVDVFEVHKEAFVEATELAKHRGAVEGGAGTCAKGWGRGARRSAPVTATGVPRDAGTVDTDPRRLHHLWVVQEGHLACDRPDARVCVGSLDEGIKPSRFRDGVAIESNEIVRARVVEGEVVPDGEPGVPPTADHAYPRVGGGDRLDGLWRAVAGGVVHNHDIEPARRTLRQQTGEEGF